MHILITGATGFEGTALTKKLLDEGHKVSILTRNKEKAQNIFKNYKIKVFEWKDTATLPPLESIVGINGVINLMGENIAEKRWTDDQKKILYDSRIIPTKNLATLLNQNLVEPLEFFISASAIGIYPINRNEALNEDSELGNSFLANLCKDWEEAAHTMHETKRIVIIRTAVVLESYGGALAKMLPPFKMGIGGPVGDGTQMMSWIHLDDIVNIFTSAANDTNYKGIYNACAPYPVDNNHFVQALGKALNRPTFFSVPTIMLKILFGEMSSVIIDSQKVVSKRLKEQGFRFKYETIEEALNSIFKNQ